MNGKVTYLPSVSSKKYRRMPFSDISLCVMYILYFELKIDQRFPNVKKTPLYQKGVSAWSAKDWGVQLDGFADQT